jgi:hypothetical protein
MESHSSSLTDVLRNTGKEGKRKTYGDAFYGIVQDDSRGSRRNKTAEVIPSSDTKNNLAPIRKPHSSTSVRTVLVLKKKTLLSCVWKY